MGEPDDDMTRRVLVRPQRGQYSNGRGYCRPRPFRFGLYRLSNITSGCVGQNHSEGVLWKLFTRMTEPLPYLGRPDRIRLGASLHRAA